MSKLLRKMQRRNEPTGSIATSADTFTADIAEQVRELRAGATLHPSWAGSRPSFERLIGELQELVALMRERES